MAYDTPFEHKAGSFSLFKNDKGDNPARPDYNGPGKDLDGNDIKVSSWIKDGPNGKFMSCLITRADAVPVRTTKPAPALDPLDIPF